MRLDGTIESPGDWLFLAGLVILAIYSWRRFDLAPDPKHLRDPHDIAIATPWNLFSSRKWTDEGVANNKRAIAYSLKIFFVIAALWILLDSVW